MTILVFANGDMMEVAWLRPHLASATTIIAANGGTRHLMALDQPPDVVIGDLDSLSEQARQWLAITSARVISHPPEKDETDLELALLYAAERYEGPIWLLGGLGGRLDQTLANILLLAHPALAGRSVQMVSQYERAWLVTEETRIQGHPGDTVSLVPLGGDVFVKATAGLLWPLREETLVFGPARGLSNVMTADVATVSLRSGQLLCVHSSRLWQR